MCAFRFVTVTPFAYIEAVTFQKSDLEQSDECTFAYWGNLLCWQK